MSWQELTPYSVTTSFDANTAFEELRYLNGGYQFEKAAYDVVGNPKDIVVDLPLGALGNPLATAERCPLSDIGSGAGEVKSSCPASSVVGYVVLENAANAILGSLSHVPEVTSISNMVPEHGYPAELGIALSKYAVFLYASVVNTASGYALRVAVPSLVRAEGVRFSTLTFFGNPAKQDASGGPETAFFTNPVDCSAGALKAKIEANSWQEPENWVSAESVAYSHLTGCGPAEALAFDPTFAMAPSPAAQGGSSQADEPSAYTADLKVPQRTGFGETATPELRDATVRLPEGLSVSPSAAEGLQGCRESGPEGIDMPLARAHPDEAGEGEEIGADGLAHLSAGHCPAASTLGTAEVSTPLLPNPLSGHVYLAQPKCGGEGQPACTQASATNGELYGLYIELAGEGVVIKLPGSVAADPSTGRLTATFTENPQFPFEDLKLHFNGGPPGTAGQPAGVREHFGEQRPVGLVGRTRRHARRDRLGHAVYDRLERRGRRVSGEPAVRAVAERRHRLAGRRRLQPLERHLHPPRSRTVPLRRAGKDAAGPAGGCSPP